MCIMSVIVYMLSGCTEYNHYVRIYLIIFDPSQCKRVPMFCFHPLYSVFTG